MQDVHDKHLARVQRTCRKRNATTACANSTCSSRWSTSVATTVVQDAWQRGQRLTVHGWIYGLKDGLMHDLGLTVTAPKICSRATTPR